MVPAGQREGQQPPLKERLKSTAPPGVGPEEPGAGAGARGRQREAPLRTRLRGAGAEGPGRQSRSPAGRARRRPPSPRSRAPLPTSTQGCRLPRRSPAGLGWGGGGGGLLSLAALRTAGRHGRTRAARQERARGWPRGSSGLLTHDLPGPLSPSLHPIPPLIRRVPPHLLVAGHQGQSVLPPQYLTGQWDSLGQATPKGPKLGEGKHTPSWGGGGGGVMGDHGEWSRLCPPTVS